jgi:hypothetical protein
MTGILTSTFYTRKDSLKESLCYSESAYNVTQNLACTLVGLSAKDVVAPVVSVPKLAGMLIRKDKKDVVKLKKVMSWFQCQSILQYLQGASVGAVTTTFVSIVSSWKNILADICYGMKSFTTKMVFAVTTGLKILNFGLRRTQQANVLVTWKHLVKGSNLTGACG